LLVAEDARVESRIASVHTTAEEIDVDQSDAVIFQSKVEGVDESEAHWICILTAFHNEATPFVIDDGNGTSHLVVL
jgi:hypothetical protein